MGLSFKDSLENNQTENLMLMNNTEVSNNETNETLEVPEAPVVRAYSLRSAPMMVNEDWTAIEDKGYRFYNGEYTDEGYSTVDELKNISLDPKQFNITQEKYSQYIPFKMPRYYDGFDLSKTRLGIYYVNENKDAHTDIPVDVYYNDDYIRFAWLVSEFATQVAGVLKFEIHADGVNSKGESYTWKSRSIDKLNVIQSLEDVALGEIGVSEEELESWYNRIQFETQKAEQYASNAQASANEAARLVAELQDGITDEVESAVDTKVESVVDIKISNQLLNYYTKAETYDRDTIESKIAAVKPDGYATIEYVNEEIDKVNNKFGSLVDADGSELTVEAYVRQEVEAVDVSDELGDLTREDGSPRTVKEYVDEAVASADISNKLNDYYTKNETYSKTEVDDALANISLDGYATETYVNNKLTPLSSSVSTLGITVANLQDEVNSIDKSPRKTYEATYGDIELEDGTIQDSMFTLWETEGNNEPTIKSRFKIAGGSGGAVAGNNLTISYAKDEDGKNITQYVFTKQNVDKNEAVIYYGFSGTDSAGDEVSYANATWKFRKGTSGNWHTLLNTTIYPNDNIPFDISNYISVGTCQIQLVATDESGGYASKTWTIQTVDIRLESNFDDTYWRPIGQSVTFDYTPYGAVTKDIHFKLMFNNGEETEIGKITTTASGVANPIPLEIPAQEHGSYLLEAYITAEVNGQFITTEPIYKDIMFYDPNGDVPVIGCSQQNITMRQYDSVNIVYYVFDPTTNYPIMRKYVDDNLVDEGTLQKSQNEWDFQTDKIGLHTLKIVIGDGDRKTEKIIVVNVTKLGIDVTPITSNLEIDFNPMGITNSSTNKLWSNGTYSMSVSPNFDWDNGGYKGEYFLVKAGTRAYFDYLMFDGGLDRNPSVLGSEMKLIFMTENVQNANAVWFSNVEKTTTEVDGVAQTTNMGIQLGVHEGWLKTNNASDTDIESEDGDESIAATNTYLYMPYSEEDIIEMDINIDVLDRNNTESKAFVMAYEDGVPSKAFVYDSSDRFYQYKPQPIVIGSDDCDVRIYRMKIYSASLTTENIMKNFIADARNSTTMLDRYDRNSIYFNRETNTYTPYSGEGVVDPERLASVIPNVKVLMLETDHFTTSKKTFVKSNFRCIHAAGGDMFEGDPYYDNWLFENGWHSGQGTTSDNYGNSSRNVDFLFNCDGVHKPSDKVNAEADYISQVTLGYGTENETTEVVTDWKGDTGKVSLTRTSVPNNFFNLKVNVASSENVNNMLLQKRYNDFLPYISPAKQKNPNVKCTMEFVPAVLFIRETNPDISTHNEFLDTDWHFYSLGNIGDSKKTDYTRAYDPEDMNEFTLEISDNTKNNSTFQSGVYLDNDGNRQIEKFTITESEDDGEIILTPVSIDKPQSFIYPVTTEEWEHEDNMRHWCIYNEGFDGDHSFEARYACCGDYRDGKLVNDTSGRGKEQMKLNEGVWRAFYRWVITSTDKEFVDELDEWCVRSAVEFFYAFTHMYTMMDNRAKNTFWHFAKTGTYRQVSKPVSELLHVYCELVDGEYITTSDTTIDINKTYYTQYAFDMHDYDNDTALGINNNGELIFPYGKEDGDYNIDGNPASGYIFNGATSVFWCRLRDLLSNEIKTTFQTVASECFSADDLIKQFDSYQECFPEEIWRLDIQRKYIRTFTGESIDNSKPKRDVQYLRDMMQGRKKYQRRQWIRDQELYFGTMNIMDTIVGDDNRITFRCFTPTGDDVVVKPDYTLRITPYSDMYVSVMFGNGGVQQKRAKAGKEYVIECPLSTMDDTQVTIYGANRIQALNDLSACYIAANNFSNASRLKKLVIGNATEGYNNPKLVSLSIGNNKLLEELDIRNCKSLTGSLPLADCKNLLKLYAEGTKLTGVTFATNGKIQLAHLPDTINTLTMRNLNDLIDFDATLKYLETLTLQGGTLDSLDIVTNCIDTLKVLYLYDIDWNLDSTELLDEIALLFYSLLTGNASVPTIGQYDLDRYKSIWSDLVVTPRDGITPQYKVTFKNNDGTTLDEQYVYQYRDAIDPLTREENPIATPTKASTIQYSYTFAGWDKALTNIVENTVVTATYSESLRDYTIKYVSMGTPVYTATGKYGDNIVYNGDIPTYTLAEPTTFYLFNRWDKSGFLTDGFDENGVKTVTAIFDRFTGNSTYFNGKELAQLSPVEIYAMTKLNESGTLNIQNIITDKDPYTIVVGNDVEYDDIDSELLISEKTHFNGTNYVDTGIQLFDKDKDFVLAIDYEFLDGNTTNGVLAQCFQDNGSNGFKLWYSNGAKFTWGTTSDDVVAANKREILVLRHKKGDNNITIYKSNLDGNSVLTAKLTRNKTTTGMGTLVFGCARADDGLYERYAIGNVNWAKVWYADLGEDVCKDLAMWTHESITLEACGFRKYYLSNNASQRCSFSLLASHLLDRTMKWNTSSTNDGGWNHSALNAALNTRLYNAMPTQIKLLLKQVIVKSNDGIGSSDPYYTEVTSSDCYITIPALVEVDSAYEALEPYASEGLRISYMSTNDARKRAFDGGEYYDYWTRSPNASFANYVWSVSKSGAAQGITPTPNQNAGVLIEISF